MTKGTFSKIMCRDKTIILGNRNMGTLGAFSLEEGHAGKVTLKTSVNNLRLVAIKSYVYKIHSAAQQ